MEGHKTSLLLLQHFVINQETNPVLSRQQTADHFLNHLHSSSSLQVHKYSQLIIRTPPGPLEHPPGQCAEFKDVRTSTDSSVHCLFTAATSEHDPSLILDQVSSDPGRAHARMHAHTHKHAHAHRAVPCHAMPGCLMSELLIERSFEKHSFH